MLKRMGRVVTFPHVLLHRQSKHSYETGSFCQLAEKFIDICQQPNYIQNTNWDFLFDLCSKNQDAKPMQLL